MGRGKLEFGEETKLFNGNKKQIKKMINSYPETHQRGDFSVELEYKIGMYQDVNFGIQIAEDGRIWICINGAAFIRFKPKS